MEKPDNTHRSVGERAYAVLREYVLREAEPGMHLKLGELTSRFAIGVMPTRIALSVLAKQDIIENQPHRGFFTKTPSYREFFGLYAYSNCICQGVLTFAMCKEPFVMALFEARHSLKLIKATSKKMSAVEIAQYADDVIVNISGLSQSDAAISNMKTINDRLWAARVAEQKVFDDTQGEIINLGELLVVGKYRELALAIGAYHLRRLKRLSDILRATYREKFVDDATLSSQPGSVAYGVAKRRSVDAANDHGL